MTELFKDLRNSKSVLIPSAFILLGMVMLSFLTIGIYKYKAQENIRANTYDQIQIIKAAIYHPWWNLDNKAMTIIVESILAQKAGEIAAIRVVEFDANRNGSRVILERFGEQWSEQTFEKLRHDSDYLFWESSVSYRGSQLGTVQAIFSTLESQREITRASVLMVAISIFITALCGALFLSSHLRRNTKILQKQINERTRELDSQRMKMVNSSRLASLGEMSAGIAHEINNPLAIIKGNVHLIGRQLSQSPDLEKVEKNLNKISEMVVRISKIISGLRAFSRDGSQDKMVEVTAQKLFSDISDLCEANLIYKNVRIEFFLKEQDIVLFGREVQLAQVLINLINNSADAIQNLSERWIHVECSTKDQQVILAVTDSGHGIAPEIQTKMMQPFFTTKDVGKGTGLGLSISVGIVESHNGNLVYCQNHKNTRFEVQLPRPATAGHTLRRVA